MFRSIFAHFLVSLVLTLLLVGRKNRWATPGSQLADLLEEVELLRRKMALSEQPITVIWYFTGNGSSKGIDVGGDFWDANRLFGSTLKAGAEDVWAVFEGSRLGGLVSDLKQKAVESGATSKMTFVSSTDEVTRAASIWRPKSPTPRLPLFPGFPEANLVDGGTFTTGLLEQWTLVGGIVGGVVDTDKVLSPLADIKQLRRLSPLQAGDPQNPQAAVYQPATVVRKIVRLGDGEPTVRQVKVRVTNTTQDEFGLGLAVGFTPTPVPLKLPPRGSAPSTTVEDQFGVPTRISFDGMSTSRGLNINTIPFVADPKGRVVMEFQWKEDGKGGRTMQIGPQKFDPTQPFVEDNPIELGDGESIL
ncbi:MAG: hypothetical protein KC800_15660 [Candidatus Eremiobacteraeota bacterium]|nr:hypothetical protein [Candidatus Eremiobacteraeota bacterium]